MQEISSSLIDSFARLNYSPGTPLYFNGDSLSVEDFDNGYKKISLDELSQKIVELLSRSTFAEMDDNEFLQRRILKLQEVRKKLVNIDRYYKSGGITGLFSRMWGLPNVKPALQSVSDELNALSLKVVLAGLESNANPCLSVRSLLSRVYHHDLDRADHRFPEINPTSRLGSIDGVIEMLTHFIENVEDLEEREKYALKVLKFDLADIRVVVKDQIRGMAVCDDHLIDRPRGLSFASSFRGHMGIVTIKPQENGLYQFSITNAGDGADLHYLSSGSISALWTGRYDGFRCQTTLTFSDIPREKVIDPTFIVKLQIALPTKEAYQVLFDQLGQYKDPVSADPENQRRLQLKGTCSVRGYFKWMHQHLYDQGCEDLYRRIRLYAAERNRELLEAIDPSSLSDEQVNTILSHLSDTRCGNDLENKSFEQVLNIFKKEHEKTLERRRRKVVAE